MRENSFVTFGSPIIDIIKQVDDNFLKKYNLKINNAVPIDENTKHIFDDPVLNGAILTPGCSSYNAARAVQFSLQMPGVSLVLGTIAKDEFSLIIKRQLQKEKVHYIFDAVQGSVGKSAVFLTGLSRSIVTDLKDSKHFGIEHITSPSTWHMIKDALCYYFPAFFLQISLKGLLHVATHAAREDKMFAFNLSAPFLIEQYGHEMGSIVPYVDVLFGNEEEFAAFERFHGFFAQCDIKDSIFRLSTFRKVNGHRKRIVVITRGQNSILVGQGSCVYEFQTMKIENKCLKDSTGAGDAFAGGFLAFLMLGKSLTECVREGNRVAAKVLNNFGCCFD